MSRRWYQDPKTVGVLALAAVTVAFAGWVLARDPASPPSTITVTSPGPTATTEPTVSLWLGDSYTAGTGAKSPQQGEACLTAKALGWVCELDAQGGTGFVADGHVNSKTFTPLPDRLDATIAKHPDPDVVVIDAGRNDYAATKSELKDAARSYFTRVRAAWPHARLVVVGPYLLGHAESPVGAWFTTFEKDLTAKYGGTFIDPGAWTAEGLTIADGVHPSPEGHEWIARHLAPAMKP